MFLTASSDQVVFHKPHFSIMRKVCEPRCGNSHSAIGSRQRTQTTSVASSVLLLIVGYSAYSLRTGYYRGWYAWLIESLVALVYGGGFIVMTPQLFINYRLKSVAHLNWKFFMYKALNTFIDDLFAFIIKMPTLHRMSCFRDDIVFAVFMYQRYIYRVDMTRRNEFGHTGDGSDAKGEATDVAPKAASTTTEAKKSKRTKKVKDA